MRLKNMTVGVIIVDGKFILPAQAANVGDKCKENPVVAALIKNGKLVIEATSKGTADMSDMEIEATGLSAASSKRALTSFAKKYGIDISGAESAEDVYTIIQAQVALVSKNA